MDHADLKREHPDNYALVQLAKRQIGKPYRWGAAGPAEFDCSGLISYLYARIGFGFGRLTVATLRRVGKPVYGRLHPGDILTIGSDQHAVMYMGDGVVISAPYTGAKVRYVPVGRYIHRASAIRRVIPWVRKIAKHARKAKR